MMSRKYDLGLCGSSMNLILTRARWPQGMIENVRVTAQTPIA